jgi:hypothetical protein
MSDATTLDALRQEAQEALKALKGLPDEEDLRKAKPLVQRLRNDRDFDLMGQLAEAISRLDPKDAQNRRLYAQCLIETGKASVAIDLLKPLVRRLSNDDAEFAEVAGLLGRAHKQIFFDSADKTAKSGRNALKDAIAAYRVPFEHDPVANSWHGVNLVALLTRARRLGLKVAPDLEPKQIAKAVLDVLAKVPEKRRDEWYLPTVAEASLALSDWDIVEKNIRAYAAGEDAKAFLLASTLRQFTEVWDVESIDERGRSLINILRARLARLPDGMTQLDGVQLQAVRQAPDPTLDQLQATLGLDGPKTYEWWKAGMEAARSVAAICQRFGDRFGTGFLVRAEDFGFDVKGKLLLLTNFHVVNNEGAHRALLPGAAEVKFEAVHKTKTYGIEQVLWSSPVARHDASLLALTEIVTDVEPLSMAQRLPVIDERARVNVIGHPRGGTLSFSFTDNALLDHEGPDHGKPTIDGVCRVHYRAPTEVGSSGSPVFNSTLWEVIALHHSGGGNMPKLNGAVGSYKANEGLGMMWMREEAAAAAQAVKPRAVA